MIVSLTYLRLATACLSQHLNYRTAGEQVNPNPRPAAHQLHGKGWPPPGRDVWIGCHRDLRRLARLQALMAITVECLGAP